MFAGLMPNGFPSNPVMAARRQLRMLEAAVRLDDLRAPSGNRLEALLVARLGQHSVRINDQGRWLHEGGRVMDERQVDWGECSLVERVAGRLSGAAVLKGTRMPVQGIVDNYDAGLTPAEVAATFDVPLADVSAILAYRDGRDGRAA